MQLSKSMTRMRRALKKIIKSKRAFSSGGGGGGVISTCEHFKSCQWCLLWIYRMFTAQPVKLIGEKNIDLTIGSFVKLLNKIP